MAKDRDEVSTVPMSGNANPDDWPALLAAARSGDNAALGEIYERLRSYLATTAANLLGNGLQPKVGASDIVQKTMLDVCRNIGSFRGNTEQEYKAWLTQTLRHNIFDVVRSYRGTQRRQAARERPLDLEATSSIWTVGHQTASSMFRRSETDEELRQAVARLAPQQQQVIELRVRRGLAYAEIAWLLGITEVAARKIWSRAVSTLGRELTADHDQ